MARSTPCSTAHQRPVTAYRLFVKFATLLLVALGVVVLVIASRFFDTETVIVMGVALALVGFFGTMPVLLGVIAKRRGDR